MEWVETGTYHYRFADTVTKNLVGHTVRVITHTSGWTVVKSLAGGWWGLHDVAPDVGPFDTKEEAQAYVEVTYVLEGE